MTNSDERWGEVVGEIQPAQRIAFQPKPVLTAKRTEADSAQAEVDLEGPEEDSGVEEGVESFGQLAELGVVVL